MDKRLSPGSMKTLKVFHLLFIMMWTMGVVMMALLNWKKESSIEGFLYCQNISLYIDYVLVIPGAICTVITGLVYGIKTQWGFFRFRWLTVKWIVGVLIIIIGTFFLHPIALGLVESWDTLQNLGYMKYLYVNRENILLLEITSTIQALGLLSLVVVSVFKPWKQKKKLNN